MLRHPSWEKKKKDCDTSAPKAARYLPTRSWKRSGECIYRVCRKGDSVQQITVVSTSAIFDISDLKIFLEHAYRQSTLQEPSRSDSDTNTYATLSTFNMHTFTHAHSTEHIIPFRLTMLRRMQRWQCVLCTLQQACSGSCSGDSTKPVPAHDSTRTLQTISFSVFKVQCKSIYFREMCL